MSCLNCNHSDNLTKFPAGCETEICDICYAEICAKWGKFSTAEYYKELNDKGVLTEWPVRTGRAVWWRRYVKQQSAKLGFCHKCGTHDPYEGDEHSGYLCKPCVDARVYNKLVPMITYLEFEDWEKMGPEGLPVKEDYYTDEFWIDHLNAIGLLHLKQGCESSS